MKKLHKLILASLTIAILSNSAMSEIINHKNEDRLLNGIMTLNTSGLFTTAIGLGGEVGLTVGMYSIMGAGALGVTVLVNKASSSTEDQANQRKVSEIIKAEIINYNTSGDLGVLLQTGIKAIQNASPELSDAEAIDAVIESLNLQSPATF